MKSARRIILTVLSGVVVFSAMVVRASGPAGCYAIVEKVVLEPNDSAPKRIQVWGYFSVTDGKTGNGYLAPQHGYLYFTLVPGKETQTLAEWSDLKKVAGSGSVIAFALRQDWDGRIRKAADKVESPDPYPVVNGITRVINGSGLGSIENPDVAAALKAAVKKTN